MLQRHYVISMLQYPTTMKTRSELSNVSVTDADAALSRDAYATSHLSAVNVALKGLHTG